MIIKIIVGLLLLDIVSRFILNSIRGYYSSTIFIEILSKIVRTWDFVFGNKR